MTDEPREARLRRLRADRRPGPKLTAERPIPVGKAEALYAGSCRLCQRPIAEGDDIAFLDGRPVHGEHR